MFRKKLLADMEVGTIHDIDILLLVKKGIKGIILDIDNTLESHKVAMPTEKTLEFLKKLDENGIKACFISNGKEERVKLFNSELEYFAIAKAQKPKKKNYIRAMQSLGLKPNEMAMVGDQIFTDVFGANRCGFYSILVEPIESIENSFFYIKRFFERNLRNKGKK